MTDEHREKISLSCKGVHKNNKHACKRIAQLDLEFNLIKIHESVTEAAKEIKRAVSSISLAAKGLVKHSGGFKWKYID